jgi:hypothetical protein
MASSDVRLVVGTTMTAVGPIITTTAIVDADIAAHPLHDS